MAFPPSDAQRLGTGRGIAVALICWALIAALQLAGVLDTLDLRLLDLRFHLRGERRASDRIALVEVDDATIEAFGHWPLPRDQYALLLDALARARARVVGLDLLFLGRDALNPRSDELLASVMARQARIVNAITFVEGNRVHGVPAPERPEVEELLARHGTPAGDVPSPEGAEATAPEPGLLQASRALGHVVLTVDRDGAVRRLPLFVRHRGRIFPSLSLGVAGDAAPVTGSFRASPTGRRITVRRPGRAPITVPVDAAGGVGVDFAGDRGAFPHSYSMIEVLRWRAAERDDLLRAAFAGRTVLVGVTAVAQAASDVGVTPFSRATPLLYVHANAVDSFLRGRFVVRAPALLHLGGLALITVLLGWLFVSLSMPWAAAAAALAMAGLAALGQALFQLFAWDVPAAALLGLPPLSYAAIASCRVIFLERKERERQRELEAQAAGAGDPLRDRGGPPPPYEGRGEYAFVSYKHADLPRIAPHLHRLSEWGYKPWYDRGIPGGAEWDALIEEKLKGCRVLVVFMSQAAADSKWVQREIKFADREGKPIVTVLLGDPVLHSGLDLTLSQYQKIDAGAPDFEQELRRAMHFVLPSQPPRGSGTRPTT